jgi:hypothetical protein
MPARLNGGKVPMFVLMNGIAWFEISADKPADAERFYSQLFGWQFAPAEDQRQGYRYVSVPGQAIGGGLLASDGDIPNYAIFGVVVEDVEATCREAEATGGRVMTPPKTDVPTGMTYAYLADPSGNLLGVSSPPPAAANGGQ